MICPVFADAGNSAIARWRPRRRSSGSQLSVVQGSVRPGWCRALAHIEAHAQAHVLWRNNQKQHALGWDDPIAMAGR
jgi:hypothetical protein